MGTMNDWIKEANEKAKQYADAIRQNSQASIDQLNQSKSNALAQLQEQQNNALYNLNTNKSTINSTTEENARQLDIARMLALKSNQQSLNRAGLGTQGIVGSQVNSINNNYNTNLASVLNEQATALKDLEKSKNDTITQYNTNKLNLETEYGNNLTNLQQSIDDKALNQYNTVYNNILALKQQEYENQQNELAQQEAIRQYNEQFEYQKQQDAVANAQKWASINASKNNSYKLTENSSAEDYLSSLSNDDFTNLYSTYGWSSSQVKELFRWANGGYKLSSGDKDRIINIVETNLNNNNMTDEEASIILYALGL